MPKILVFWLILCFCFDTALACTNHEVKVVAPTKSQNSLYTVGRCLKEGTALVLKDKEYISLKHNKSSQPKKVKGPYSDKVKIDKGLRGFIEELIRKMITPRIVGGKSCYSFKIGNEQEFEFCMKHHVPFKLSLSRKNVNRVDTLTIKNENNSHTHKWQLDENKVVQLPLDKFPIQAVMNYHIISQAGNSWKFNFQKIADDQACKSKYEGTGATIGPMKELPLSQN